MAKKIPLEETDISSKKEEPKKKEVTKNKKNKNDRLLFERVIEFYNSHLLLCGIVSLVLVVILSFIIFSLQEKQTEKEKAAVRAELDKTLEKYDDTQNYNTIFGFKEIKLSDLSYLTPDRTIVVLLGREDCKYTASLAPKLQEVADEYKAPVRIVDIAKIVNYETGEALDSQEVQLWDSFLSEKRHATPTLLFVKDNQRIGTEVIGDVSKEQLEMAFTSAGFTKK